MLKVCSMIAKADSHQCVSSKVENYIATPRTLRDGLEIPDVTLNHLQARIAILMTEIRVMTRLKIVENYDLPFVFEQPVDKVASYEPQPAGDECPLHPITQPLEFVCMSQLTEGTTLS
jgi:hypothetical protein